MKKLFDKYYGFWRKLKWGYVLYNLVNFGKLSHIKALYRKYGIKKSRIAPVSSSDFEHLPENLPWLDLPDAAARLAQHKDFDSFAEETKAQLKDWPEKGYMILSGFFSHEEADAINLEVQRLIDEKVVDFNFTGRKIMFAHRKSKLLREVARNPELIRILSFVLGKKVIPFQTINFIQGSEQRAHSDFIHMTTYPKGNLIAAWIALEDIGSDCGPLIYYPGSHKLPYLLNNEYDHGGNAWMIGNDAYLRYEDETARRIKAHGLTPKEFHARKGDVLIWHANLIHAGKAILNEQLTRKSMVVHFYAEDVICYHELTQRPALTEAV